MTAAPSDDPGEVPWLGELLSTVGEFGSASLGLVAWELCLSEHALREAWEHAIEQGMIDPAGRDPETEEEMYRLVPVQPSQD